MATSRSTRNTPRVQTCAAPSLRPRNNIAWRESINHFLFNSYSEYSSSRWFLMLKKKEKKKTEPENKPCFQGVQRITTSIFPGGSLCHSRYILEISWKSIRLFVHNIANRHTAAPRWETVKQCSQAWNSLSIFLCRARYIMKKLMKIRSSVFP